MKMLFISPRPFGMMGTPGTYLLVEAYSRSTNVTVIASSKAESGVAIVHRQNEAQDIREVSFGDTGYVDHIAKIALEIDPDLICVCNYHGWYEIVNRLKALLPDSKYVLDIKSPLVSAANSSRQLRIQKEGQECSPKLDLILSRCAEDVDSWIPRNACPTLIYPLGVKVSLFHPKKLSAGPIVCKKFVYIGAYSVNRKLLMLLEFISTLPISFLNNLSFHFYGSGGEKEKLCQFVIANNLQSIVQIFDSLPQQELLKILPQYDAGIGWVPTEIYDAAPSLKVLEYFASGLVPVISSTKGHRQNVDSGFRCVLFEETAESFRSAIERAFQGTVRRVDIKTNIELMKLRDWDAISKKCLLPAFESLVSNKIPNAAVDLKIIDHSAIRSVYSVTPRSLRVIDPPSTDLSSTQRMRILMISPRPFGLMGTPGTYLLAETYAQHADVLVVANKISSKNAPIVHYRSQKLSVQEVSIPSQGAVAQISEIAKQFTPDIIWLGNYSDWPNFVIGLRSAAPNSKLVLDIKSPLLTGDSHLRRQQIQSAGIISAVDLHLVIALSEEDVKSWIPAYSGKLLLYPLGVKVSRFHWKIPSIFKVKPKRFVFIGSYHPARKLDLLLEYLFGLPEWLKNEITFDMFGDGPDKLRIENIVNEKNMNSWVTVNGSVDQVDLCKILPEFDAGIGWVPTSAYDAAPPLKTLEYMGSGLIPIVTDSTAHRRYKSEGFHMVSFEENQTSFVQVIRRICREGFDSSSIVRNLELLVKRDFENLVLESHLPAFRELIDSDAE